MAILPTMKFVKCFNFSTRCHISNFWISNRQTIYHGCNLAHNLLPYTTSAQTRPTYERAEPQFIENLMRKQGKLPDDLTVYIKPTGNLYDYTKANVPPPQLNAAADAQNMVKKNVFHPVSVEDFLYIKPTPLQSTPNISQLPAIYASLSKSKLTLLVVLTAMGGYALAPGPFSLTTICLLTAGTALQSAAANSTNQVMEVKYDTQMYRTRNRVLVKGLISRGHAATFAATTGILGTGLLYYFINPLTCCLGAANYLLYTSVYTPMKRISITNTWVGSFVGALPPLMGWTAATGSIESGGLWLASILYIWQFPHFKALSWNIKSDYQRAGYLMSSVYNPELCKRVAFRHTILMTGVCLLGPYVEATTNMFVLYSLPCNLYGVYLGWKFYSEGDSKSSRNLFRFSLLQIPFLLLMMLVSKNWQQNTESPQTITPQTNPSS